MGFNLAILISGKGSNMLNIIEACQTKNLRSSVKLVISNNPNSQGIKEAKKRKIKTSIISDQNYKNKKDFENTISQLLVKSKVNLICLAGFMKVLTKNFVTKWNKKIINIHPSLLPSFRGIDAQKKALIQKVKYTGCTVHYVNKEIDGGEILDQRIVKISKKDSLASLKKKILIEEHKLYISVIRDLERKFEL